MKKLVLMLAALASTPVFAADSDIVAARDAFRSNSQTALQQAVSATRDDLLAPYPRYWLLSRNLDTASAAEVRDFLQTYADGPLAELLRRDWLKRLGKNQLWGDFAQEYAKLPAVMRDEDVICYDLVNRTQNLNEPAAWQDARARWFSGRAAPAGCNMLNDVLLASGKISQDDIWARIRLLLTANQLTAARTLSGRTATPLTAAQIGKPGAADPSSPAGRELRLYAVQQTARSNIDAARSELVALEGRIGRRDAGYAWGQLGLAAARKLAMPTALDAYSRADTTQLNNDQWEWWARAALREGRWDVVQQVIEQMPAALADDADWLYWRGRALKERGQPGANTWLVKASDAYGYYGLLAREELGNVLSAKGDQWKPGDRDLATMRKQPAIARALALFDIANRYQRPELREDAKREWRWAMRDRDDQYLITAAEVARQANFYDMAIYSADRTKAVHDWELRYLSPYRDITRSYARQLNLDEAWIYGLIRQESRFVHIARSGVGATGLMQVMPATARWIAGKIGMGSFSANDIGTNIQLGTWYLRYTYDRLDGQTTMATAAYNAGPGRARAWQDSRPLEGAIWAETIPFTETRDYVQKVMGNAMHYAMVFGHSRITLKERLGVIPARSSGRPAANGPADPSGGE